MSRTRERRREALERARSALGPVVGDERDVASVLERAREHLGGVLVVVDDEDARFATVSATLEVARRRAAPGSRLRRRAGSARRTRCRGRRPRSAPRRSRRGAATRLRTIVRPSPSPPCGAIDRLRSLARTCRRRAARSRARSRRRRRARERRTSSPSRRARATTCPRGRRVLRRVGEEVREDLREAQRVAVDDEAGAGLDSSCVAALLEERARHLDGARDESVDLDAARASARSCLRVMRETSSRSSTRRAR